MQEWGQVMQEYITYKMGLIDLLDEDFGTVLFLLEQVWEVKAAGGRDTGNFQMKSNYKSLQDYLPIGTEVETLVRS